MKYSEIITTERLRKSTTNRVPELISETESDKARIIFSAPFRRLQKKAQVFPLESNAAVRSRLTHSLEVSVIGRQIAQMIAKDLWKNGFIEETEPFVNIVESACLLHDIGNPPFGHFGEAAISNWFKEKGVTSKIFKQQRELNNNYYIDFENFDGNAQGLRIIAKLQGEDHYGLNLTCSVIAAYLKYPHSESTRIPGTNDLHKKPGYFLTEADTIKSVWSKLSIPSHIRSPLTFIMEAADDIAYCLSDIEDGIEKKLVKFEDFIAEIKNSLKGEALTYWENLVRDAEDNKSTIKKFIYIRTNLITRSAKVATKTFFENEESILSGCFYQSLINKTSSEYQILKAVRSYVALNVYTSREAEIIELSGNSIITGLLEKLSPLLEIDSKHFKLIQSRDRDGIKEYGLDLHSRLFNLLPSQCIKSYAGDTDDHSDMEWICRSHMIIDYISGMTDDFALEMYQKLMGIRTV